MLGETANLTLVSGNQCGAIPWLFEAMVKWNTSAAHLPLEIDNACVLTKAKAIYHGNTKHTAALAHSNQSRPPTCPLEDYVFDMWVEVRKNRRDPVNRCANTHHSIHPHGYCLSHR